MVDVRELILSSQPESLDYPVLSTDHSGHIVYLATSGYPKLAADHILNGEVVGRLEGIVGGVLRQFNLISNRILLGVSVDDLLRDGKSVPLLARIYETLIQMALNIIGLEKDIVGFSDEETTKTFVNILETLKGLEVLERKIFGGEAPVAHAIIDIFLADMKKVMSGFYRPPGSMVAYIAREIEKEVKIDSIMESFLYSAKKQIENNIYYRLGKLGMCRFGNDYALGLRWLRHLGFVQVSTNPVLAAAAYEDDPSLWEGYRSEDLCPDFKTAIKQDEEWLKRPDAHGDELAAKGTEVSIWPNLVVFRPIAIASNMRHGLVSLQLNPTIADNYERSLQEALKIYFDAEEFLRKYDYYLLWGYSACVERGRPNIVFKVAGSSPAAIELTRKLESLGIGTNNTVTFTVSQEVELILAKIEGRSEAVKKGISLTTVYETNMGGRLDDHIREVQAEELVRYALEKLEDKEGALKRLAEALGAWDAVKDKESLDEKIRVICSRRYLSPLNKKPFVDFLASCGIPSSSKETVAEYLTRLEEDIGYCGILVTKRVYEIFFNPENRLKWLEYIRSKYGLTSEQAEYVLQGIDVLPASKRKPKETLLTLSSLHMTHTEFPNHQMNVLLESLKESFRIKDYQESVLIEVDPEIARRLMSGWRKTAEEFIKAYELTSEQIRVLREVGFVNPTEKYGSRGIKPSEWGLFGATVKTMDEFTGSYELFKKRCIEYASKFVKEKQ
ncbi:MAG: transaldolase family protein [Candidatus Bathyarchaeia archaeon]